MLIMSVRFSQKFSFQGQVATCEVNVTDKQLRIKRTFVGMTLKEAFDNLRSNNVAYSYDL